jgi:malonyl-CoA decarboxylase
MVNYRYILDDIEKNHEAYMKDGRISVGNEVKALAKGLKDIDSSKRNLLHIVGG